MVGSLWVYKKKKSSIPDAAIKHNLQLAEPPSPTMAQPTPEQSHSEKHILYHNLINVHTHTHTSQYEKNILLPCDMSFSKGFL